MTQTKAELLQTRHQGDIRLGDADSTNYVGFKAPATVGSNLVWTLPATDGSANQFLQTNASGVLGWGTADVSSAMPLSGGTFTGDVTFDGATAGRDIVFDRSDNALEFADNAKAVFGSSTDLSIYHDASNSYIKEAGTGQLHIQADNLILENAAGANYFVGISGGETIIYHNDSAKLTTASNGVSITGALTVSGNLTVSGTTTTVDSVTLSVKDKNIEMGVVSSPSDTTADGGGITLKGASDKTFNWVDSTDAWTSSEHLHLGDNKKLFLGTGQDYFGVHDGNNTYLRNATGSFNIQQYANATLDIYSNHDVRLRVNGGELAVDCSMNSSVDLYHNNVKKFETTSTGINVTGAIQVNGSALASGNSIDLVADGAIGAGKPVVLTTAGKITAVAQVNQNITNPSIRAYDNIPSNLQGYNICGIWHQTSGKGLIMYKKGTNNSSATGKYRQFRLDSTANNITNIDTEVGFEGSYPSSTKLIMDPDIDKPIMCWTKDSYIYTRSVTIDGNGANHAQASTQGASTGIYSTHEHKWDICYDTNANIFVAVYTDTSDSGKGKVKLGYQTEPATGQHKIVWINTLVEFSSDCESPRCVFDTANNKVIIAWGQAGGDVSACIGTVSNSGSSATISVGSRVVVNSVGPGSSGRPKMAWNTTDGVAGYLYRRSDNNQNALITLKTSGTTVHYTGLTRVGTEDADEMAIWYVSTLGKFQWSVKGRIGWISSTGSATSGGSGATDPTVGSGAVDLSTTFGGNVGGFEPSQGFDLPDHPLATGHCTSNHGGDGGRMKLITLTIAGSASNATDAVKLIGFSESAISDGNTGTIKLHGSVVGNQSSLTIGSQYYIQGDGTIGTSGDNTVGNVKAGTAVSATQLIICDPRV